MSDIIMAFVADLMFQTRIESVAERLGIQVQWLLNENQIIAKKANGLTSLEPAEILINHLVQVQPKLLIFDLGNDAIPWAGWIPVVKTNSKTQQIPIICFGSHVDVGTLKKAKQVGADEVLARSRFVTTLPTLIQKYIDRSDDGLLETTCEQPLHPDAKNGLELFNIGDYYGAHEQLEQAWKDDLTVGRDLYRGVLQIAVAYYQIQRLNYPGAVKMFRRARKWLDPLPDTCRGIDVAQLRSDAYHVHELIQKLGPERMSEISSQRMKPVIWGLD